MSCSLTRLTLKDTFGVHNGSGCIKLGQRGDGIANVARFVQDSGGYARRFHLRVVGFGFELALQQVVVDLYGFFLRSEVAVDMTSFRPTLWWTCSRRLRNAIPFNNLCYWYNFSRSQMFFISSHNAQPRPTKQNI